MRYALVYDRWMVYSHRRTYVGALPIKVGPACVLFCYLNRGTPFAENAEVNDRLYALLQAPEAGRLSRSMAGRSSVNIQSFWRFGTGGLFKNVFSWLLLLWFGGSGSIVPRYREFLCSGSSLVVKTVVCSPEAFMVFNTARPPLPLAPSRNPLKLTNTFPPGNSNNFICWNASIVSRWPGIASPRKASTMIRWNRCCVASIKCLPSSMAIFTCSLIPKWVLASWGSLASSSTAVVFWNGHLDKMVRPGSILDTHATPC